MNEKSKKIPLIGKIKTLVSRTGQRIILRKKAQDGEISEKAALKIQKASYIAGCRLAKDSFTPPYLTLVKQLDAEEDQIFRAAVHNLANIAVERTKYRNDILAQLVAFADNHKLKPEQQAYIREKINYINASKRHK